jgi:hypothetical protein
MKCIDCDYYKTGYQWNCCTLLEGECFMPVKNCDFVNDDQTINEEKMKECFGEEISFE